MNYLNLRVLHHLLFDGVCELGNNPKDTYNDIYKLLTYKKDGIDIMEEFINVLKYLKEDDAKINNFFKIYKLLLEKKRYI